MVTNAMMISKSVDKKKVEIIFFLIFKKLILATFLFKKKINFTIDHILKPKLFNSVD